MAGGGNSDGNLSLQGGNGVLKSQKTDASAIQGAITKEKNASQPDIRAQAQDIEDDYDWFKNDDTR